MNTSPAASTAPPAARILLLCFCAFLLVVLNVVVDPRAMDISLIPRLLALQIFLILCIVYVAWSGVAERIDFAVLRDPLIICFAGYTLATVGSLAFAVNPSAGFTDAAKTFSVFLVLVLACLLLPLRADWPELLMKFATVAAAVGLVTGLLDWPWSQGWLLHGRSAMETVEGLMSNVNLYASFLLLVLPLSAAASFVLRGWWRWAAGTVSILLLGLVLLLQTRAVYLGLSAAALVAAFLLVRTRSKLGGAPSRVRDLVFAALLFLIAASAFLSLAPRGFPAIERFHSIWQEPRMTAAGGRPVIWLASLGMIRDHALTGVGAGNFPVRLHEYFAYDDPEFSQVHPNWLQPHNDFLWVFAEKGFLGFLFFVAIWIFAFKRLRSALRQNLSPPRVALAIAAASGLSGYLIVSLFDFPLERINHQVYVAFYLAICVLLGRPQTDTSASPQAVGVFPLKFASLLLLAALMLGTIYAVSALRQERFIRLSRVAFAQGDWEGTLDHAKRAATSWKTLDPFATPVAYFEGMGHLMQAEHAEALEYLQQAHNHMPSRAYILNGLGLVHTFLRNYPEAESCYEEVLRRSPRNAAVLNSLAAVLLAAGNPQGAIDVLARIPRNEWSAAAVATAAQAEERLSGSR